VSLLCGAIFVHAKLKSNVVSLSVSVSVSVSASVNVIVSVIVGGKV
jgi:hypothetical protein